VLQGSILQILKDAHASSQDGARPLNLGVYYKNTLVALCHALEDAILAADYQPMVLTAFQRGKWYLQEADRYGAIAERSPQIVIMAAADAGFLEHPTSQRTNVAVVSLEPSDPVAQEWHLIIVSPDYTAMVLCQELSAADYGPTGVPSVDLERKFYGLWTFEPSLVQETAALMIHHLEPYDPELCRQLAAQLQDIRQACQQEAALCGLPTADHIGEIVTRVVEYLQDLQQDLTAAPSYVERIQSLDKNLLSNEIQAFLRVAQLVDQTDLSNPQAAAEVSALAEGMGQLLDLPAWQLHRLRLAALLHRVAFLQAHAPALTARTPMAVTADLPAASYCPLLPGIQVLRKMPQLRAIATILTHQTEWWSGAGQPAGLSADEIPLESRILGLMAVFQQHLARHRQAGADDAHGLALVALQAEVGDRWDPKLVEVLALLVNALQQGLDLPVALPKIAAGLWLLDAHAHEYSP
jgi:DICT domain-containing protein